MELRKVYYLCSRKYRWRTIGEIYETLMSRCRTAILPENRGILFIMDKEKFDRKFKLQDVVMPCIYFLLDNGEVVYVGKTEYGLKRVLCHISDKVFDEIKVKLFPPSLLDEKETYYIAKYHPKYNHSIPNVYSAKRIKQLLLSNYGVRVRKKQVEAWIDDNVLESLFFRGERHIDKNNFDNCISYFTNTNQDGKDI